MHRNHRRKHPVGISKREGGSRFLQIYPMKPMKRMESRLRRARERHLIVNGRWDELRVRYHRSIVWDFW